MNTNPQLDLIVGTMFSGKSTELIRRMRQYEITKFNVQVFKPIIDDRYSTSHVVSHDGVQKEALYVNGWEDIEKELKPNTEVIGIDEVQFFGSEVIDGCERQVSSGKIVVAAGLLKDFRDDPFGFKDGRKTMLDLLARADNITTLYALCTYANGQKHCGDKATRVQRFLDGQVAPYASELVRVGGSTPDQTRYHYEARCRQHYQPYKKE